MYLVRTKNGKTIGGYKTIEEAEKCKEHLERRILNSPLANGVEVEIRKIGNKRKVVA